jgi:hypothetical protein
MKQTMEQMKRKSQIQYQVFIYVTSAVLIVLILIFAFKAIGGLKNKNRLAQVIEFEEKLKSIVDLLSGDYNAAQQVELRVPDDVDTVCFVDLNKRKYIINSTLGAAYPEIKKSLADYVLKNTFMISKSRVTDSFYAGNLCLSTPYFKCIDTSDHILRMLVKGKKNCVDIIKPLRQIDINNYKNDTRYERLNPFFLIQLNDPLSQQRNNEILQVVPVAMWNNRQMGITSYPYNAFFEIPGEGAAEDFNKLAQKNRLTFGVNTGEARLVIFTPRPAYLSGMPFVTEENFAGLDKYWTTIVDVVVTPTANTDGSLTSSLFASYLIAPMVFVDSSNYNDPEISKYIIQKRVYIVDSAEMDAAAKEFIIDKAKEVIEDYDSTILRVDTDLNPYSAMISDIYPTSFS